MGRIIYVDLDNTLFDTIRQEAEEVVTAAKYGIHPRVYKKLVRRIYEEHRAKNYTYQLVYNALCAKYKNLPPQLYKDLQCLLKRREFAFPDAFPFLTQFPDEELMILTIGHPDHQLPKIYGAGFMEHIGGYICAEDTKSPEIVLNSSPIFFVDDAPRIINEVKTARPDVVCIQVREPPPWEDFYREKSLCDFHAKDLIEAAEYINKY